MLAGYPNPFSIFVARSLNAPQRRDADIDENLLVLALVLEEEYRLWLLEAIYPRSLGKNCEFSTPSISQ
jgi:hypothetical protein